jgi:hypothetical protein
LQFSYSEETLFDVSFRFLFSKTNESQVSGFTNIGYGKYYPIVPKIISPGIYFEAGIGMDWIWLFFLLSGTNEPSKNEPRRNENAYQFGNNLGSNLGFRLFNLTELGIMDINLFVGYNLSTILNIDKSTYEFIHNPIVGTSITFRLRGNTGQPVGLGLDYAYYIPTIFSNGTAFHHLALMFRFREGYWD